MNMKTEVMSSIVTGDEIVHLYGIVQDHGGRDELIELELGFGKKKKKAIP